SSSHSLSSRRMGGSFCTLSSGGESAGTLSCRLQEGHMTSLPADSSRACSCLPHSQTKRIMVGLQGEFATLYQSCLLRFCEAERIDCYTRPGGTSKANPRVRQ